MPIILFVNGEVAITERVSYRYAKDMRTALERATEPCVIFVDGDMRIWLEPTLVMRVTPKDKPRDRDLSLTIAIAKILRRVMKKSGCTAGVAREVLIEKMQEMEQ